MSDIGAVIVTWNSAPEIGPCLDSVEPRVARAVVVDNASTDGTRDKVLHRSTVELICNSENRGFAAAVNQGIRRLGSPFVLLLNPDAVLQTGVGELAEACRRDGVAAAAGKLVDESGRPQTGFSVRRFPTPASLAFEVMGLNRLWPRNPVNRRYRCLELDPEAPAEVEQPAGAFLMLRRDAWAAVGGFDEAFHPVWFEDVDFLQRLHRQGLGVRYVPSAVAVHRGGHSVHRLPEESRQVYWYASLLRYSCKHFATGGRAAVAVAVIFGSILRAFWGIARERRLTPVMMYGRVVRSASLQLIRGQIGEAGTGPAMAGD